MTNLVVIGDVIVSISCGSHGKVVVSHEVWVHFYGLTVSTGPWWKWAWHPCCTQPIWHRWYLRRYCLTSSWIRAHARCHPSENTQPLMCRCLCAPWSLELPGCLRLLSLQQTGRAKQSGEKPSVSDLVRVWCSFPGVIYSSSASRCASTISSATSTMSQNAFWKALRRTSTNLLLSIKGGCLHMKSAWQDAWFMSVGGGRKRDVQAKSSVFSPTSDNCRKPQSSSGGFLSLTWQVSSSGECFTVGV